MFLIHISYNSKAKSFLFALLVITTTYSGCDLRNKISSSGESALTVVDYNWKIGEFGNRFIAGTLINNSEEEYTYVEVSFNLYDGSGEYVGSTFTNMNNLMPNEKWNFVAVVINDEVSEAKLKGVTGF